jgi:hypothetical protein
MTQTKQVLLHLVRKGPLTPGDAQQLYGVNRLAARIKDLRNSGIKIDTAINTGGGKRIAEYRLSA